MNEIETENEVTELLEMLYNTIADAWGVPLGKDKCMVPRESTLSLLDDIRASIDGGYFDEFRDESLARFYANGPRG